MVEKPDDGSSAFPVSLEGADCLAEGGDTFGIYKRDYFAAAALQGIISSALHVLEKNRACESAAISAYEFADAMLKARKQ